MSKFNIFTQNLIRFLVLLSTYQLHFKKKKRMEREFFQWKKCFKNQQFIMNIPWSFCQLFKKQNVFVSSLFQTKYTERNNLQLLYIPNVASTFPLSWATRHCVPPQNLIIWRNNYMTNQDNTRDVHIWSNKKKQKEKWIKKQSLHKDKNL